MYYFVVLFKTPFLCLVKYHSRLCVVFPKKKKQMVLHTGESFLGFRAEYSVNAQTEPKTTILLRFAQTEISPYCLGYITFFYGELDAASRTLGDHLWLCSAAGSPATKTLSQPPNT